jgi:hypothetical protein
VISPAVSPSSCPSSPLSKVLRFLTNIHPSNSYYLMYHPHLRMLVLSLHCIPSHCFLGNTLSWVRPLF